MAEKLDGSAQGWSAYATSNLSQPQHQYVPHPAPSTTPASPPPQPHPTHTNAPPIVPYHPNKVGTTAIDQAAEGPSPRQYDVPEEKGYRNALHERGAWRIKWPNAYQKAGTIYARTSYHHRDVMQRGDDFPLDDYYLSPTDGHLAKLYVQCTQSIYDSKSNSTWKRTFIRNQSPLLLQASNFVLNTRVKEVSGMSDGEKFWMAAKWIPSCAVILLCLFIPAEVSGEVRNGGKYDPLPYKFWGYPYHAKNAKEAVRKITIGNNSKSQAFGPSVPQGDVVAKDILNPLSERPLEPKTLCFLAEDGHAVIQDVSAWKLQHPGEEATYILVSYYTKQFESEQEQLFLHDVGEHAAKAAGVKAYWVGASCLGDTEDEQESTVWQISDTARGASGLAIALSHPTGVTDTSVKAIFREWGSRVWTLPEVLFAPSGRDIQIYSRTRGAEDPMTHSKRAFATLWSDAPISRELIENYEGSMSLSPLELVTIALRCFHNRQTIFKFNGDMTYALMGLLRRRPTVVKSDSAFQAFARLSLANDSDALLERLICTLPLIPNQPWYNMSDQWNASLWDIVPTTQVCGIGDNDTVIVDGAYAASIRWKSFAPVANLIRESWKRLFLRWIFRSIPILFIIAVSLISSGASASRVALVGIGAVILVITLVLIILSPWIIRILYAGKIWGTQAWFFGFEGYLDIETIESHIFGSKKGHLKWSASGSPLSRHYKNKFGECIGEDPTTDADTVQKVKDGINARSEALRIFTLVDTYTLTVTLFEAARPPVAVLLCGEEGGMQRALLCSYEWNTQTLFRESVLRMETIVLEQMARVGRVRVGLTRSVI